MTVENRLSNDLLPQFAGPQTSGQFQNNAT